jgi:adenylate cyclase
MERKLSAILSADVQGYSRLMGEDEVATIRTLTAYREVMAALIRQHRGRVVDSPGDNLLAEFASVVDAVQCGAAVQQELKRRNADLPTSRKMEFRIGINLGDVIVEGERIYGEGVNIAARLEGLAEAGGVCVSGSVYDQIETTLALGYEYLGEQTVKNIAKPVRVYRVVLEPGAAVPATIEATARGRANGPVPPHLGHPLRVAPSRPQPPLTLPDIPSIAVLPFVNMSGNAEQEYFSDGMTEDIITDLAKLSGLFVIARHASFLYKGKAVKPAQVSRELGVRYVLEGSVRKAGNRVRISAQLVDATSGYHLWAERYDRDLQDMFAVQDEITTQIVTALAVKLMEGEQQRVGRAPTRNLEAYDSYLRGRECQAVTTEEGNAQARQLFDKALRLDPQFAVAAAYLGWTYFTEWVLGWSQEAETLEQASALARRAIAHDATVPDGHRLLGMVCLWQRQYERAIAEVEHAAALTPHCADGYAALGDVLNWAGRPEEAIGLIESAMRLNPQYPAWYLWDLGHAYYVAGRYEEAMATLKRVLIRNPDFMPAHAYLGAMYVELGQEAAAQAEGEEVMRLNPQLSLAALRQRLPYKDQTVLERVLNAVRKQGWGELAPRTPLHYTQDERMTIH